MPVTLPTHGTERLCLRLFPQVASGSTLMWKSVLDEAREVVWLVSVALAIAIVAA
jgi:hypothetical protein